MAAQIKKCPFCGSDAKRGPLLPGVFSHLYMILCTNKGCGATVKQNSSMRALRAWNKRVG